MKIRTIGAVIVMASVIFYLIYLIVFSGLVLNTFERKILPNIQTEHQQLQELERITTEFLSK